MPANNKSDWQIEKNKQPNVDIADHVQHLGKLDFQGINVIQSQIILFLMEPELKRKENSKNMILIFGKNNNRTPWNNRSPLKIKKVGCSLKEVVIDIH